MFIPIMVTCENVITSIRCQVLLFIVAEGYNVARISSTSHFKRSYTHLGIAFGRMLDLTQKQLERRWLIHWLITVALTMLKMKTETNGAPVGLNAMHTTASIITTQTLNAVEFHFIGVSFNSSPFSPMIEVANNPFIAHLGEQSYRGTSLWRLKLMTSVYSA